MWHQKAKGPPDGPPIFLIFVEKLNCPQSQAYQSISPVGTGLSLTDRALGVSLGTSIGNYSPLIAPQPVKLKIPCPQGRAGSTPATGTKKPAPPSGSAGFCIFEMLKAGRHSLCLPALWSLKFRLRLGENGAHVGHFFAERERDGLAVVGEPVGFAALALAQQIGEQER